MASDNVDISIKRLDNSRKIFTETQNFYQQNSKDEDKLLKAVSSIMSQFQTDLNKETEIRTQKLILHLLHQQQELLKEKINDKNSWEKLKGLIQKSVDEKVKKLDDENSIRLKKIVDSIGSDGVLQEILNSINSAKNIYDKKESGAGKKDIRQVDSDQVNESDKHLENVSEKAFQKIVDDVNRTITDKTNKNNNRNVIKFRENLLSRLKSSFGSNKGKIHTSISGGNILSKSSKLFGFNKKTEKSSVIDNVKNRFGLGKKKLFNPLSILSPVGQLGILLKGTLKLTKIIGVGLIKSIGFLGKQLKNAVVGIYHFGKNLIGGTIGFLSRKFTTTGVIAFLSGGGAFLIGYLTGLLWKRLLQPAFLKIEEIFIDLQMRMFDMLSGNDPVMQDIADAFETFRKGYDWFTKNIGIPIVNWFKDDSIIETLRSYGITKEDFNLLLKVVKEYRAATSGVLGKSARHMPGIYKLFGFAMNYAFNKLGGVFERREKGSLPIAKQYLELFGAKANEDEAETKLKPEQFKKFKSYIKQLQDQHSSLETMIDDLKRVKTSNLFLQDQDLLLRQIFTVTVPDKDNPEDISKAKRYPYIIDGLIAYDEFLKKNTDDEKFEYATYILKRRVEDATTLYGAMTSGNYNLIEDILTNSGDFFDPMLVAQGKSGNFQNLSAKDISTKSTKFQILMHSAHGIRQLFDTALSEYKLSDDDYEMTVDKNTGKQIVKFKGVSSDLLTFLKDNKIETKDESGRFSKDFTIEMTKENADKLMNIRKDYTYIPQGDQSLPQNLPQPSKNAPISATFGQTRPTEQQVMTVPSIPPSELSQAQRTQLELQRKEFESVNNLYNSSSHNPVSVNIQNIENKQDIPDIKKQVDDDSDTLLESLEELRESVDNMPYIGNNAIIHDTYPQVSTISTPSNGRK